MFHHRKKQFNTEPHRSERSSFGTLKLNGMRATSTPTPGRSLLKTARSTDTTPTFTNAKTAKVPPLFAPVGITSHICCKLFHKDRETCTHKEKKKKTRVPVGILALMPEMHPTNIIGADMCIQAMKPKSHRVLLNIYHIWSQSAAVAERWLMDPTLF